MTRTSRRLGPRIPGPGSLLFLGLVVLGLIVAVVAMRPEPAAADSPFVPAPPTPGAVRKRSPTPTPRPKPSATPTGLRLVLPGVTSADLPPPTPTPTAPVSARRFVPAPHLEELRQRMQAAVDGYGVAGAYAVAVTDLQTGETVSVGGSRIQIAGCVMNLFPLVAALQDAEWGVYPVSRVDALVAQTIWHSDASTARTLYGITGGGDVLRGVQRAQSMADALGLDSVLIDHAPGYPSESLGIDANNWLSAEDVNRLLAALWRGELLSEPYRTKLLDQMTHVQPGLNYLLASGQTGLVSHKNGFLYEGDGWVDNDAGIVRFTRGNETYAYAITFLAMDVETYRGDVALGQSLVRMAWQHFAGVYGGG